jgi:hypothetical protein
MQTVHLRALNGAALTGLLAAGAMNANAADFGVFAEVGTFGLGGGAAVQLNERFSARAGYSTISGGINDYEAEDLDFDADVTIGAAKLLVDWYPTPSSFRITAGAMLNQTKATAVATPTGGGYTINGTFYPFFVVGSAAGRADFDHFTPYLGVGFGRALDTAGRFNVTVDIGAAFVGDPDVSLNATCTSVTPASVCTRLQQDIAAEQADVRDDADDLNLWPYANVSFSWRL